MPEFPVICIDLHRRGIYQNKIIAIVSCHKMTEGVSDGGIKQICREKGFDCFLIVNWCSCAVGETNKYPIKLSFTEVMLEIFYCLSSELASQQKSAITLLLLITERKKGYVSTQCFENTVDYCLAVEKIKGCMKEKLQMDQVRTEIQVYQQYGSQLAVWQSSDSMAAVFYSIRRFLIKIWEKRIKKKIVINCF